MSRQNFNDGQEIIYQDLNKINSRTERLVFDKVLFELIGRSQEGFFQDSFKVSRISNTSVSVSSGLGFQLNATDDYEPDMKPIVLDANSTQIIPTANPTDDRIDLIVVKSELVNGASETRKFKDAFTELISNQSMLVNKLWSASFQVVSGTPDPSPVKPSVPAGYIELAEILVEAANGVVSESNVTDSRELLPLAASVGATGSREWDAVVGDSSLLGVTHETLKAALDDSGILAGSKILVLRDETISNTPSIDKNDIELVFKPGVTFTKGTSLKGLIVNANGCRVKGARFADFSTGGDIGIEIAAGKVYNFVNENRFSNCDTSISGVVGNNVVTNNIEE